MVLSHLLRFSCFTLLWRPHPCACASVCMNYSGGVGVMSFSRFFFFRRPTVHWRRTRPRPSRKATLQPTGATPQPPRARQPTMRPLEGPPRPTRTRATPTSPTTPVSLPPPPWNPRLDAHLWQRRRRRRQCQPQRRRRRQHCRPGLALAARRRQIWCPRCVPPAAPRRCGRGQTRPSGRPPVWWAKEGTERGEGGGGDGRAGGRKQRSKTAATRAHARRQWQRRQEIAKDGGAAHA